MTNNVLDNIDLRQLGGRLRELRNKCGMTQADAAKVINAARTTMVAIEKAIDRGIVEIVDFDFDSDAETGTFVNYLANNLGDGEAATCAIAVCREWAIAADDRKAISFIKQEASHVQILSTPEIIKHWSDAANVDFSQLSEALNAVQLNGRYSPPKSHPLKSWWDNASSPDNSAIKKLYPFCLPFSKV